MTKRIDLTQRVLKAVEWMERHINEDVALSDAAAVACLSEYHFYRLFKSMTGLSPGLYLRRRRLSMAAENLLSKDTAILELALDAGYETQESFTRAFKIMFGMPPGHWRTESGGTVTVLQSILSRDVLEHFAHNRVTLEPEFRQHRGLSVRGIGRNIEIGNAAQVDRIWGAFLQECERGGLASDVTYGICSAPVEGAEHSEKFLHYMAGYESGHKNRIEFLTEERIIAEGRYAVFGHKGSAKHVMKTIDYIWRTWLPQSSCELANVPDFEVYDGRFNHVELKGEFEIWLPVKA